MKDSFCVVNVEDGTRKSSYTREVLGRLPEWFGNKEAVEEYVGKTKELPYWAALNKDGRCIGFFAVKIHYKHTGEIIVCGVCPECHNNGIGKALYNATEKYFIQNCCKYVIVKTLSDKVKFEPYARTREFYRSIGFSPLVTLEEMWNEENPCLIMIKVLIS